MTSNTKSSIFVDPFSNNVSASNAQNKAPESLSRYLGASTVLTIPAHDPRNAWRDFLCIQKMHVHAYIPTRGSPGAAGYDLCAFAGGCIPKWTHQAIGTQIKISMPPGVYGRLASRSGLSYRSGIEVGAGVIDADYQGEIKVILYNLSDQPFNFKGGDRIAQLILEKYLTPVIKVVTSNTQLFGVTTRGSSGLGSTGN
jgi:dUTP pyrophosphatase